MSLESWVGFFLDFFYLGFKMMLSLVTKIERLIVLGRSLPFERQISIIILLRFIQYKLQHLTGKTNLTSH